MQNSRVAIYCRLSKEDERHGVSESIQNQEALLRNYATEQNWDITAVYFDDNFSGIDRERPDFCRLLHDAKSGKFDIILVKTQSRFTRDMEVVEKYIHNFFPIWGIRFVAVLEGADTQLPGNKKSRQIHGLVNEWYLEDLSENIRAVLDVKRREGKFIGSFPPYGYRKDPKDRHKLLIDEPAADVVRQIFRLCLLGMGKDKIAQTLNDHAISNPTAYKREQGLLYVNGGERTGNGSWSRTSIGRILHHSVYLGDLVQGVRRKVSYKSKILLQVPPEEWVVAPQTHEAIITPEQFETVQTLLKQRTRSDGTGHAHMLAGKVLCRDCKSLMVKYSHTYRGIRREYLRCGATKKCVAHTIRLDLLESTLWNALYKKLLQYNLTELHIENMNSDKHKTYKRELLNIQREIEKRKKALQALYLDKTDGLISREQFSEWSREYQTQIVSLELRCAQVSKMDCDTNAKSALVTHLTRGLILAVVRSIEIGERQADGTQKILIQWNF